MRKCPVCDVPMNEKEYSGEIVDRCPQCNGIYFDKGELEAILEIIGLFQNIKLDENEIDTIPQIERDRKLYCPDDNTLMEEQDVGGLIIDVCPKCGSIWLDDGEISALKIAESHIKKNLNLYIRLGE